MRKLIKADGTVLDIGRCTIREIRETISADTVDTVALHDRSHVMFVDDDGVSKELPENVRATALYYLKCGRIVDHRIRGDVIVVPDEDFAGDPEDAGFAPIAIAPERTAEIEFVLSLPLADVYEGRTQ